jgi:hypothetical protein
MISFILLTTVVLVCSLIHSLLGMGLLLFGTPTLLLMGYTFSQTLAYLLFPSVTISLLQLLNNHKIEQKFVVQFISYCLPTVCLCLIVFMYTNVDLNLELAIAFLLLISVLLRCLPILEKKMQKIVRVNQKIFLLIMGCVHGFTNMGGGLLSVFVNSQYTKKEQVLSCVSFCYVFFGILQLTIVYIFQPKVFSLEILWFCIIAGSIYLTLGKSLFASFSENFYKNIFTVFMVIYAGVLITKGIGLI